MKINKFFSKYTLISLTALLVLACSKEEENNAVQNTTAISFTGNVSLQTKATATAFEDEDAIGIYAMVWNDAVPSVSVPLGTGDLYAGNIQMKWETGAFSYASENRKLYWPSLSRKLDLYAYYPYNTTGLETGTPFLPVKVLTDQSNAENLTASDVMTALLQGKEKTAQTLTLPFKHALSKLKVILIAGTGFDDTDLQGTTILLKNVMTGTTLDLTKLPSETGFTGTAETPGDIKTFNGEAIIVPQEVAEGQILLEVYDKENNKMTEVKAVAGKNTFSSSQQYNITITLKKTGANISADITDWLSGDFNISQEEQQSIELTTDKGSLTSGNVSFTTDDKIGLFATQWEKAEEEGTVISYLTNHELNWNDNGFTGNAIYWPTAKRKLNFYAYAPFQTGMTMDNKSIPVSVNQNQHEQTATDWLIGSQEAVDRTSGQVIFTFSHVLSRIKVKIINGTGFDTDPINGMYVELANTLTSAQVNMVTRVVTPVSSETVKAIRLKQKDSNQEFSGAFIPQSVAKDKKLLMIYDSEGRLAASLTLGETKTFVSGKDYSIEVTLKKSGLGFSADITDWAAEDWGQADANQDWEYAN